MIERHVNGHAGKCTVLKTGNASEVFEDLGCIGFWRDCDGESGAAAMEEKKIAAMMASAGKEKKIFSFNLPF